MAELSNETLIELGKLMHGISHNPETRKEVLKSVKKFKPDFTSADLEVDNIREEVSSMLEKERFDRQHQETLRAQSDQRQNLINSGKYSSEDVKKIEEEVMTKYGLSDYDAAATLYSASTAPARGTPEIKSTQWQMPNFKGLQENPRKWAMDEANAAMSDIISNRNSRR